MPSVESMKAAIAMAGGNGRSFRQFAAFGAALVIQFSLLMVLLLRMDSDSQGVQAPQPSSSLHMSRAVLRYVPALGATGSSSDTSTGRRQQQPPAAAIAPPEGHVDFDTLPPGLFNPSIALHNGEAYMVVRSQFTVKRSSKQGSGVGNEWGLNSNHLASVNLTDWTVTR